MVEPAKKAVGGAVEKVADAAEGVADKAEDVVAAGSAATRVARRSDRAAQTSLTTTSSWVPRAVAGPSSTFQPRSRSRSASAGGRPRVAAVLEQRAHQPALGRLVEVADHLAHPVGLVEHPHRRDPAAPARPAGARTPAYVLERRSTSSPRPSDVGDRLGERLAPRRGDRSQAGERGVAGEPVGGDPVGRPEQPEDRRGDGDPGGGPASGRGGEAGEVERVVEHAGVDPVGARRRRGQQPPVALEQVGLGVTDAEQRRRVVAARWPRPGPRAPGGGRRSGTGGRARRGRAGRRAGARPCPRSEAAGSARAQR